MKDNNPRKQPFEYHRQVTSSAYYDVLVFGDTFEHFEVSDRVKLVQHGNHQIAVSNDGQLSFDGVPWDGSYQGGYKAYALGKLETSFTNLPQTDFFISGAPSSAVSFETTILAHFSWLNKSAYRLQIFANDCQVYVNGKSVTTFDGLFGFGDQLILDGLLIERHSEQLRVVSLLKPFVLNPRILAEEYQRYEYPLDFPEFRRGPRIYLREPQDKISITSPKPKKENRRGEILRMIVPPLGMVVMTGAVTLISRRNPVMLLGMGGASLLTAGFSVSSFLTNRKETEEENRLIEERYQNYVVETASKLSNLSQEQIETLDYNHPSVSRLVEMVQTYDSRIYEKMPAHEDFLDVRLGLGKIDSSYRVDFSERDQADEWEQFVKKELVDSYKTIEHAPIIIPLREQTLGLSGAPIHLTTAAQTLLFQLAVMHSYHDVEFVALVSENEYQTSWSEWRWLPHFQLSGLNLRGLIYNEQTRDVVLNSFYQIITKRRQQLRENNSRNGTLSFSPHYILTILDDSYLLGHGLNEFLAEDMSQYGVTVIWAKESRNMLPETATAVVDYQNSEVATLIINQKEYVNQLLVPNRQSDAMQMSLQRLANLKHVEVEKNAIPESIGFLELYGAKTVEDLAVDSRWKQADTSKTLAVPLGVRGKDDIVYLNLHERAHGPHGLVAGTTGSGKSEILQSYILSLAVNFAPEDVGFLPIDFKGGGMANLFANLPHLMGAITNLDGAASARALKSIRAELQKRQREFGKFGVNHINGYTKLYKEGQRQTDPEARQRYPQKPLPHLFLISDEFAELKANEPEFMAELVSTARIGRSLGVHLILATQKPSGVVDDQIWSNSRFKLALKVADTSDSNEIIKTPDAASIVQPGRAYLQVGNNEIYELFQSAWSGAQYQPDASDEVTIDERIWIVNALGQTELLSADLSADEDFAGTTEKELTELEAVIDVIAEVTQQEGRIIPDKPWLPPLAEAIVTPQLEHLTLWQEERTLSIPIGYLDIPEKQEQKSFIFDIEEFSHFAILGSAGFGKSTALQTFVMNLARSNSPEQVHIYLFDFATNGLLPLKELPHVADIVTLQEEEKLVKYLKRIRRDIQIRKDMFAEYGVATLAQYEAKSGEKLPVITVILDGYDAVQESSLSESIDTVIAQILREGSSLGIYLVMSALRASSFRLAINSNLPTRMALFLVEDNGVKEVVGREALIPQEVFGRAQIKLDEGVHEFQFYLPAAGENDIERLTLMEEEIQGMRRDWQGTCPHPIPMLPRVLELADFYEHQDVRRMLNNLEIPLAFDKETTDVLGFKPKEHGYFLIAEDTAQQSDYLSRTIVEDFKYLADKATRIIFNAGGRYTSYQESFDVFVEESEYTSFLTELSTEIDEREANGWTDVTFIYIPDAHLLNNHLLTALELFNKLMDKGAKNGVYVIFQGIQRVIESAFDEFNKRLRSNIPAGIFGTRVSDQNLLNVKIRIGEPVVPLDEANYFEIRDIKSIKLNQ